MVRAVKNREELEKLYKGRPVVSIREEEYFFWIELKNGKGTYLEKVLKVLSLETIQKILLWLGFPPRVVKKTARDKKDRPHGVLPENPACGRGNSYWTCRNRQNACDYLCHRTAAKEIQGKKPALHLLSRYAGL